MATTLQSLLTLLRQQTNMESGGAAGFVTDSELTTYLNNSLSQLDDILISKFSHYKLTNVLVSAQPSSNYIQLPADFVKLQGVDVYFAVNAPDGYWTMSEYSWEHRNNLTYPTAIALATNSVGGSYMNLQYSLQGNQIVLRPGSIANNYTYRLSYSPAYILLVNPSDTLQPYMDTQSWCQYAVYDSAVKVLTKQDLDATMFNMQSQMLRDHIIKLATPNRNAGEPKCISDVRSFAAVPYGWGW
jgi:hypothetical protein